MSSAGTASETRPGVPRYRIKHLLLMFVVVSLLILPVYQFVNNQGHGGWKRASPFTDVLVEGDAVEVEFQGARYELVAINGASTEAILLSARRRYGWRAEKRFIEDLP